MGKIARALYERKRDLYIAFENEIDSLEVLSEILGYEIEFSFYDRRFTFEFRFIRDDKIKEAFFIEANRAFIWNDESVKMDIGLENSLCYCLEKLHKKLSI